ncbi:uncharacterized protein LOC119360502 [Triticum dicoccoides]|uniref:uncharacterized protein LOC119360502 n=1 Tax=Triticum dicoccoides TaxID=85692 RepID=UPI00188E7220|nr:uncharacterized protein LOC119360502 [Triticum dicoccoides]XP_044319258.1 uncharacterized protein LOC123040486 [Triticum aestivum]
MPPPAVRPHGERPPDAGATAARRAERHRAPPAGDRFEGRRRGPGGERRGQGVGPPASSSARTLKGVIRRTRCCGSASSAPARGAGRLVPRQRRRTACLVPRGRRFGLTAIGGPRRLHLAARGDGERVDGRGGAVCRATASAAAEACFEEAAAWTDRRARRTGRAPPLRTQGDGGTATPQSPSATVVAVAATRTLKRMWRGRCCASSWAAPARSTSKLPLTLEDVISKNKKSRRQSSYH